MTDKKRPLKVVLTIEREGDNDEKNTRVDFKTDGNRFEAQNTIKLNVDASYKITITLRPASKLSSLSLLGAQTSFQETQRDIEFVTYTASCNTNGFSPTKRGKRDKFCLNMNIHDYGQFEYVFQVKFYKSNENNHVHWGNPLHHAELECEVTSHIKIVKETFR